MKVCHFNLDIELPCSICKKKVKEAYHPIPHTDDEYDKLTQFLKQPSEEWLICEDCLHKEFAVRFHVTRVYIEGGLRVRTCEEILSEYYGVENVS